LFVGSTPLHTAAQKGHVNVVSTLIKYKADIEAANNNGVRPLNSAAHKGHLEVVKCLLKHAKLDAPNKNGITPLYSAAHRGHYKVVELLLSHNANIEGTTKNHGATPLYISAQEGYKDIVELLLRHSANVEAKIWYIMIENSCGWVGGNTLGSMCVVWVGSLGANDNQVWIAMWCHTSIYCCTSWACRYCGAFAL
jgi:ankyrin repeat protein